MLERDFQAKIIRKIKSRYKDSIVLKNDAGYIQGIPDITILYGPHWAVLEFKKNSFAHHQANQEYYIDIMNKMSYAAFIFPENEEEVFNELDKLFES